MATLTLQKHSLDVQNELEKLADKNLFERSDIPSLIKKIVSYAINNQGDFVINESLNYNGRDFDAKESDFVYKFEVTPEARQKLIDWAKQRIEVKKVKELLLKQVKFILIVYFAKGLNYNPPAN